MSTSTSMRLLAIIDLFAGDRSEWTVEAAAEALGLTSSTAYRHFRSLVSFGLLHSYLPGRYVLGPAIVRLDRRMRATDALITAGRPVMERMAASLPPGMVLLLVRLYHSQVMCVHQQATGSTPLATSYERGRLMPLHRGASSKAILAHVAPRLIRAWSEPPATGGDPPVKLTPELRRELRRIKAVGYSTTLGELDAGIRGVAVPVFGISGAIAGSLSIVGSASELEVADVLETLVRGRKSIEANLALATAAPAEDGAQT